MRDQECRGRSDERRHADTIISGGGPMQATMMRVALSLNHVLERAGVLFPESEIVSRLPDKSLRRHRYADFYRRARALAAGLLRLGLKKGERVATLCWNHHAHLECYFGIPAAGGVMHTLNLRLAPDDIGWIAGHAEDRFLIVDDVLLPLYRQFAPLHRFERLIVFPFGGSTVPPEFEDYEALLAAGLPDYWGLSGRDRVLAVTPMFHANCWGIPYGAVMLGSKLVFPGPHLHPADLLDLMQAEPPTLALGVPTIWLGMIQTYEAEPGRWRFPPNLRTLVGEIQVRGPFITGRYHGVDDPSRFSDGWLRTGDVGSVDPHGYVRITDRTKDLIKSGGEWISSVDLENAIMAHPAVAEAAVIAIAHERWGERPLACVVLKAGKEAAPAELDALLSKSFAKWQLPDRYDFVAEIPRTSTGKFWKAKLRERYGRSSG